MKIRVHVYEQTMMTVEVDVDEEAFKVFEEPERTGLVHSRARELVSTRVDLALDKLAITRTSITRAMNIDHDDG